MIRNGTETASYEILPGTEGSCYTFYCDLSGAKACTTGPVRAATPEEELRLAWTNEGRAQFNLCHKCGKWVIDAVYNADVCECVQCTPWENQHPRFCKHCGARTSTGEVVCGVCQKRLYY